MKRERRKERGIAPCPEKRARGRRDMRENIGGAIDLIDAYYSISLPSLSEDMMGTKLPIR
jgi:hypothetical protein